MNKATIFTMGLLLSLLANTGLAQTSTTATTTVPATTEATSSTTTAEAVKPDEDKKFSAILFLGHASDNLVKNQDEKDANADIGIDSLHFLQLGYKVTKDTKVSLRQYFTTSQAETAASGRVRGDGSAIENVTGQGRTDIIVRDDTGLNPLALIVSSPLTESFLGSSPVSGTYWWYLPVQKYDTDARSAGLLRAEVNPTWDIGKSGVTLGWYARLTQNLTPRQYTDTGELAAFSRTGIFEGPTIAYAVSDKVNLYTYSWLGHYFNTEGGFQLARVRSYYELGVEYAATSKLTINPLISQDYNLQNYSVAEQKAVGTGEDFMSYRPADLSWEIDVIYSF